jgi:dTMP kinase
MGFIVIEGEGLDGSGKSTQLRLVEEYLEKKSIKTRFIHFPRTDSDIWGELISRFLRGELGDINTVNPYLIALIYAGDRKDAAPGLLEWMRQDYMVIADRYLYSNIAFQCAKLNDAEQRTKLAHWIKKLEYEYYGIPIPDLNLFLSVPFGFTRRSLEKQREGADRGYLNGAIDIHEADLDFQARVREIYLWQVKVNNDFELIDCGDSEGKMLDANRISEKIIEKIKHKLLPQ